MQNEVHDDKSARQALAQSRTDIERFFAPKKAVAIAGSVDVSANALNYLKRLGEDVKISYINPKGVGGTDDVKVYKSALDLPDGVDLVVVKVGPATVPQLVEDCAKRGIKNIIVFSSGFAEVGPEGVELEKKVAATAKQYGVRIIGPNTNDNTFEKFAIPENHRGGLIALITQSGYNGRPIVEGINMGVGFRRWVTAGNEVDLEVADFIEYFAHDDQASVIACYVEGFKSVPKLRAALETANEKNKPVIMLKMGSTERGAKMAASHTGHLSGSDAVATGLFRQFGVTRVRELDELQETANLFAKLPKGCGIRAAMYSPSGGSSTLMAEVAEQHGVPLPVFSKERQELIYELLPRYVSVANPVDNGGGFMMTAKQPERVKIFQLMADDPGVDVIVVGLSASAPLLANNMCADILAFAPTASKPVIVVWGSVVTDTQGYRDIVKSGVPIFRSYRKCFMALRAWADYQAFSKTARRRSHSAPALNAKQNAALSKPGVLSGNDATTLLKEAGIPLAGEALVNSASDARKAAESIGFPVAMKLVSPNFPHKSDVGLVKLGVSSGELAEAIYTELVERAKKLDPKAQIDGVVVQEQVGGGVEMIVGLSQDPVLGPALTVGAGGIYAEILRDVAVRPLPVDEGDIREMIDGLRLAPLLAGARGAKPADKEGLVKIALKVAQLGLAAGPKVAELDLNPIIVQPNRAVAVDSLVVAGE